MVRFAANVSTLFTEVPFLDRFARARAAGFERVEFQYPYDVPATEIAAARAWPVAIAPMAVWVRPLP